VGGLIVGEKGRRGREERREERAGGLRAGKRARASGVRAISFSFNFYTAKHHYPSPARQFWRKTSKSSFVD